MEVNQDINARRGSKRSGVCQRGIYDNVKTAVEAIFVGKARHYNRRFVQMCSHHLIETVGRKPRRSPLGITTPFGGFNGGVLATPDLAIIAEHLLSPEIVRRAVDMLKACGAEVWLFSGHDWLVGHSDEPYVALEERTEGFPPTIVEDFGAALDTNAKTSSVSARISSFSHGVSATRMPRSSIKRPSFVRNLTTSTSPTRLQTKASHYPRSRICWLFR